MGTAIYYDFQDCDCLGANGRPVTIPAGRHPVAERDVVTVIIGSRVLDLDKNAFNQLKAQRKVTIPLL